MGTSRKRVARLLACAMLLALLGGAWAGCVVRRSDDTCERQSNCSPGSFCTGRGFCEVECVRASDCPCGSFCATGCGICLRDDLLGPATCVAYQRGLSTNEVLGACGADIATTTASRRDGGAFNAAADDAGDAGACNPPPTLPECIQSPPLDATAEAESTDAGDEAESTEEGGADDGAPEASIVDATSETGGDQ